MPLGLGLPEMLLIAFLALLFFGRDKLTGLAKDMGSSIRVFRKEMSGEVEAKDSTAVAKTEKESEVK